MTATSVHRPSVGARMLTGRILTVGRTFLAVAARVGALWVVARLTGRRAAFPRAAAGAVAARLHQAGPTFVKLAQLLSTRLDLLPAELCKAFSRLYDDVPAIPAKTAEELVAARMGAPLKTIFARFDLRAVASGSIACVYRATLFDGTEVAVKLRRPGVEEIIAADLRLIAWGTALAARTPMMRGLPAVAAVRQMSQAIAGQLDFTAEAAALVRLSAALKELDEIKVPLPHPEYADPARTGRGVLVMEYLPGLARRSPADLGEQASVRAVEAALAAIYKILFLDGLVHCDLHPGNLYLMPDGSVQILDAGFVVELPEGARRAFTEFFFRMGTGNGKRCAEIVLSTAMDRRGLDEGAFTAEMVALVESVTGVRAGDFDLLRFAGGLFDMQRRHGLHADPQFIFPLLGILVFEGAINAYHPEVDFQELAMPYLVRALFTRR
ncbi:AarF/UbiB family protein [Sphaerisporangium sp. NPDC088356]|uniref:ABC1 kinase family protein n=1 Tax=Sphaerisporangium sp. NPDC088356 TaxID=3154871 RepID=UPI003433660C